MDFQFTNDEATGTLAALVAFIGGCVLASYVASPFIVIAMAGTVAQAVIAHRLVSRTTLPTDPRPFLLLWGVTGLGLFFGLGIPSAVRRLR